MEVHLIGPFPPPCGGVSIHIYRLHKALRAAGHQCFVWCDHDRPADDLYRLPKHLGAVRVLSHINPDAILHFHGLPLYAGLLAMAGRRVVYTAHNGRVEQLFRGGVYMHQKLFRRLRGWAFRHVRNVIAVSDEAARAFIEFGVKPSRVRVINAYMPPDEGRLADPENLEVFASFRARLKTVATANAWALEFHNGQDLYGMDMCLDMTQRIVARHPDFGVALAVPCGRGTRYLGTLQARAAKLGITDHVLWLLGGGAYHHILKQCDLFLRPTNTDGFSLSIAESFEYGVPVLASDAAARPKGCVLFHNRDVDDFVAKIEYALANHAALAAQSRASREPDHFRELLTLYASLPPCRVGVLDWLRHAGAVPAAGDTSRRH